MAHVCVLRLGHRTGRDQRITTHVFLAARALGADEGVLCGDEDESVLSGIRKVAAVWGGKFEIHYEPNWRKFVLARKKEGWKIAHLTMYGEDFARGAKELAGENTVVIVGAGKVPREAYELADKNLAVLNQPHSEISALALFLDRFFGGKVAAGRTEGKIKIIPNKCGKTVVHVDSD